MADALSLADPLAPRGVPLPQPRPNLLEMARQKYPVLRNMDIGYVESFGPKFIEAWSRGEPGTQDRPRPPQLDINKPGLEVPKGDTRTRVDDIMADIVSHWMTKDDPTIKGYYDRFVASMTPDQKRRLHEQYVYSQTHLGEKRKEELWREMSGLPAWFRGYAFNQWPKDFTSRVYTPQQRAMFDKMMRYLMSEGQ